MMKRRMTRMQTMRMMWWTQRTLRQRQLAECR